MLRRDLLLSSVVAPLAIAQAGRPSVAWGAMIGDLVPGRAMVWSRCDRPSRMRVLWSSGGERHTVLGPHCLDVTDFTGRAEITGLPADAEIRYEVVFESLSNPRATSEPVSGTFRTPSLKPRDVTFLWTGDLVGQGWGINPDWGGFRIYETMLKRRPDFFLHSGDVIYADQPLVREVKLADGSTWRNVVTPEKSKVAETLDEFRGNYRYNLLDEHMRRFHASVPQIWQWDDHEVMNNWSPSKDIRDDARYTEKNVPLLVARATRAFLEYSPIRYSSEQTERVYRRIPCGPLLDVFVIDMRSYRGPNTHNRQPGESEETVYLGREQIEWLKAGLRDSKAVWKAIASDMPLGLLVGDGKDAEGRPRFEASANGDGPPLGREIEIAGLLGFLNQNRVRNVVWFTADTHYTAAHHYKPAQFDPFWEFVSGPMHAGTFGPNALDNTFGIEVVYQKHPPKGQGNLPPSAGMQFFGEVRIDARTRGMTVTLRDVSGAALFTKQLQAS